MHDPEDTHPLAPHPATEEEGALDTDNSTQSVNVRAGIEVGAMRYVLWIGLFLAIVAFVVAYFVIF